MGNTTDPLKVVTFKLPRSTDQQLSALAARRGSSRSALVREALRSLVQSEPPHFLAAASRWVGSIRGAPADLATNPAHLDDFGRDSATHDPATRE